MFLTSLIGVVWLSGFSKYNNNIFKNIKNYFLKNKILNIK